MSMVDIQDLSVGDNPYLHDCVFALQGNQCRPNFGEACLRVPNVNNFFVERRRDFVLSTTTIGT